MKLRGICSDLMGVSPNKARKCHRQRSRLCPDLLRKGRAEPGVFAIELKSCTTSYGGNLKKKGSCSRLKTVFLRGKAARKFACLSLEAKRENNFSRIFTGVSEEFVDFLARLWTNSTK